MSNSSDPKKKKVDLEEEVDQEAWEREDRRQTAEIAHEILKKYKFIDPDKKEDIEKQP
jgi:hypothetical protein